MNVKKRLLALVILAAMLVGTAAADTWHVKRENEKRFGALLTELLGAYEKPSSGDGTAIDAAVSAIASADAGDGTVAAAIADHWKRVYLDKSYRLWLHDGGDVATALWQSSIPDSASHAFVVLGYELKKGRMTKELKGRCDAAAAAARAFPNAILVCSGGPTGKDNPQNHTEAGLMRDYLVNERGIDAERIFIDERAMTTVDNAVNTFAILRERGVSTITLVTSSYHQRWGQVLYNAMAAICHQTYGQSVEIVENFCFDTEPSSDRYRKDARIAISQLASMLDISMDGSKKH